MKMSQVRKLRAGDRIYWNDPDESEGNCSRWLDIVRITIRGDIVAIEDNNGEVECFARELAETEGVSNAPN